MCDACMSMPVPLEDADLSKPFVHSRRYGVFYVPFGKHQVTMALLYGWENGHNCAPGNLWAIYGVSEYADLADLFLQTVPGAAFRSGVSNSRVTAGLQKNLHLGELSKFGSVDFLFEKTKTR